MEDVRRDARSGSNEFSARTALFGFLRLVSATICSSAANSKIGFDVGRGVAGRGVARGMESAEREAKPASSLPYFTMSLRFPGFLALSCPSLARKLVAESFCPLKT